MHEVPMHLLAKLIRLIHEYSESCLNMKNHEHGMTLKRKKNHRIGMRSEAN